MFGIGAVARGDGAEAFELGGLRRAATTAVQCDPDFQTQLALPDLSQPTVVSHADDGTTMELTLRYEYTGQLDPIARKVIGGRELTWIQALRLDTTTYKGTRTVSA